MQALPPRGPLLDGSTPPPLAHRLQRHRPAPHRVSPARPQGQRDPQSSADGDPGYRAPHEIPGASRLASRPAGGTGANEPQTRPARAPEKEPKWHWEGVASQGPRGGPTPPCRPAWCTPPPPTQRVVNKPVWNVLQSTQRPVVSLPLHGCGANVAAPTARSLGVIGPEEWGLASRCTSRKI